jgi:hypothetical protein
MKTTYLLFALILACAIPTYSQINRNRKLQPDTEHFSFYPSKKNEYLGNYKFADRFRRSMTDSVQDSSAKNIEKADIQYNMPCLKPVGVFSMRIYKPDSTVTYTMLVKKH